MGSDGTYQICVRLEDAAENYAYAKSGNILLDQTDPTVGVPALANDATDGYINIAEEASTGDDLVTAPSASDTIEYELTANGNTCSGLSSYASAIPEDDTGLGTSGDFKVCVKGTDAAGNTPDYDSSVTFTSDQIAPSASSAPALANEVADLYLNAADKALANALSGAGAGAGHDNIDYDVILDASNCNTGGYGASIPLQTDAGITVDGSDYKVCARYSDLAGNTSAYNSSVAFGYDGTAPNISAFALFGTSADGYINDVDNDSATDTVSSTVTGHDTLEYKITTGGVTDCSAQTPISASIIQSNDGGFSHGTTYRICLEATDDAGNPAAYAVTGDLIIDEVAPSGGAVALANEVVDTWLNIADKLLTSNLSGTATASNDDQAEEYTVVTAVTNCNVATGYSTTIPKNNNIGISADGTAYHVCAKFQDAAGNAPGYANTATFTYDGTIPVFTSLTLAAVVTDTGYVNEDEVAAAATDLATTLSATGHTDGDYDLVADATTCNNALTFTEAFPQTNDGVWDLMELIKFA